MYYSGGGVILYDENGVWLVKELERGKIVYTDIGGKIQSCDKDIYDCICRELEEETYHTIVVDRNELLRACKIERVLKTYLCLMIHTSSLNVKPDSEKFLKKMYLFDESIPGSPTEEKYKQLGLIHVSFNDLMNKKINISSRLNKLLNW